MATASTADHVGVMATAAATAFVTCARIVGVGVGLVSGAVSGVMGANAWRVLKIQF